MAKTGAKETREEMYRNMSEIKNQSTTSQQNFLKSLFNNKFDVQPFSHFEDSMFSKEVDNLRKIYIEEIS